MACATEQSGIFVRPPHAALRRRTVSAGANLARSVRYNPPSAPDLHGNGSFYRIMSEGCASPLLLVSDTSQGGLARLSQFKRIFGFWAGEFLLFSRSVWAETGENRRGEDLASFLRH